MEEVRKQNLFLANLGLFQLVPRAPVMCQIKKSCVKPKCFEIGHPTALFSWIPAFILQTQGVFPDFPEHF